MDFPKISGNFFEENIAVWDKQKNILWFNNHDVLILFAIKANGKDKVVPALFGSEDSMSNESSLLGFLKKEILSPSASQKAAYIWVMKFHPKNFDKGDLVPLGTSEGRISDELSL